MDRHQKNHRSIQPALAALRLCLCGGFLLAAGGCVTPPSAPPEGMGLADPFPWVSYEAESGQFQGALHGPSRKYLTPEAEASGKSYVRLENMGDFVEVEVTEPANTIVVRASIPDAPEGRGTDATLSLYRNDEFLQKMELSSRYAWVYGRFPWFNHPDHGKPHRFFDESHAQIDAVKPGDTLRLQIDEGDSAAYYLVDLIELEQVPPPIAAPADSLSITNHGAKADDGINDAPAFLAAIQQAKDEGRTVWIPPGTYRLDGSPITLGGVAIQGSGMWHSRLTGSAVLFRGNGETFRMSDLAIFGNIDQRFDATADNAFNGNLGEGSLLERLWIEHVKCGVWSTPGTRDLRIIDCRIRNTMADGINFCDGSSRCRVERSHIRNTGDDGLATWSPTASWASGVPCSSNVFLHNRVEIPWLANGIAIYGGSNHRVIGNTVIGNVYAGAGITLSTGHGAEPFGGTIVIQSNRLIQTGSESYFGSSVGGLWLHAPERDIEIPVRIAGVDIEDPYGAAISVQGPKRVADAEIRNVRLKKLKAEGIHILPNAQGSLVIIGLDTEGEASGLINNESGSGFTVKQDITTRRDM